MRQVDDTLVARLNRATGCCMQDCRAALEITRSKYLNEEQWLNDALNWLRAKKLYKGETLNMAEISAALVGRLREKTGARLMDCKKALTETAAEGGGDESKWTAAAEAWLRKKNIATGEKVGAEKAAQEGLLGHKVAGGAITVVEMTANTDFVAKNDEFRKMLADLVDLADKNKIDSLEKLNAQSLNGTPVQEAVKVLAGKIGENIGIKRVVRVEGDFGYYIHHNDKEGAIVQLAGVSGEKATAVGKDIAMHVVFAKPSALTRDEVPQELIKKETDIATEKLKNDPKNANKPPEILSKIVQGQINKFYGSIVLPDQPYYKDGNKTVAAVLKESGATVKRFVRFQVGVL
ncbi:MAG TPA: translation elongation factor Ts [Planctomycetota bacterium]|nr:translation elongation factor Ts [Planctomycetota bacterium]